MASLELLTAPGCPVYSGPIADLDPALLAAWRTFADGGPDAPGPFLDPTYSLAVGAVGRRVEVAVFADGSDVTGVLPYERSRFGVARPVGGRLCDRSGPVLGPGVTWDPAAVTHTLGLRLLRMSNVPAGTDDPGPFMGRQHDAPCIDLAHGFDAYRRANLSSGSNFLRGIEVKRRRLERDVGPTRLEWHASDDAAWTALLRWKALQRRATRTPNVLELPWARALLLRLRGCKGPEFEGVLSALYAGETLCAVHFGMRTRRVLHYWVPTYSQALGRYSPGLICLMMLAQEAAQRGIERIDLGPGDERYKHRAANSHQRFGTLTATRDRAVQACVRAVDAARAWSRGSDAGSRLRGWARRTTRGVYLLRSALGRVSGRASKGPLTAIGEVGR